MVSAVITRITFTPEIREEDGFFIAICHEMNVAAPGQSAEEATARLMSTLRTLFANLRRKGLLERTLHDSGIMAEPASIQGSEVVMEIETV